MLSALQLCSCRKNLHPPRGRSSEIPRERGVLKVKILEEKFEAKLEFSGGGGGTLLGGQGSVDIFWNCILADLT